MFYKEVNVPLYEFNCKNCKKPFERYCNTYTVETTCPVCGKLSNKIMSPSSFVVNGHNEKNGYSKPNGNKNN